MAQDIIGANGEIANCRYLLFIVGGNENIIHGTLIAYILAKNQV